MQQNLCKFLYEVAQIIDRVVVWSLMMYLIAKEVADFLLTRNKAPFEVHNQEHYRKIEMSQRQFLHRGSKLVFLKVLSEQVFSLDGGGTSFTTDNTLLIDDSPKKSLCNEKGNTLSLCM